jgi:hypothetical protein
MVLYSNSCIEITHIAIMIMAFYRDSVNLSKTF